MSTESTISFPRIFNIITRRGQLSYGTDSINQCLELLLLTSRGELIGDPLYGTDLLKCTYEHNDSIMNDIIKNDIVSAISKYMSKIISVSYDDISIINESNKVLITISYYINKTDSIGTYELVMLKEVDTDE